MKLTALQYWGAALQKHKTAVFQLGAPRAHQQGIQLGQEGSEQASANGDTQVKT